MYCHTSICLLRQFIRIRKIRHPSSNKKYRVLTNFTIPAMTLDQKKKNNVTTLAWKSTAKQHFLSHHTYWQPRHLIQKNIRSHKSKLKLIKYFDLFICILVFLYEKTQITTRTSPFRLRFFCFDIFRRWLITFQSWIYLTIDIRAPRIASN
jgi:hypothetical protein